MDDQSPNQEMAPRASQPGGRPSASRMSSDRLVAVFLISTFLGFLGTLIGFVPLIAIAMICPIVAASLP